MAERNQWPPRLAFIGVCLSCILFCGGCMGGLGEYLRLDGKDFNGVPSHISYEKGKEKIKQDTKKWEELRKRIQTERAEQKRREGAG